MSYTSSEVNMDMMGSSIEAKMTRRNPEKVFRIRRDPGNMKKKNGILSFL